MRTREHPVHAISPSVAWERREQQQWQRSSGVVEENLPPDDLHGEGWRGQKM